MTEDDTCEWKYYENDFVWETSCKHAFQFEAGDVAENEFAYCPYCGKKIEVRETEA